MLKKINPPKTISQLILDNSLSFPFMIKKIKAEYISNTVKIPVGTVIYITDTFGINQYLRSAGPDEYAVIKDTQSWELKRKLRV